MALSLLLSFFSQMVITVFRSKAFFLNGKFVLPSEKLPSRGRRASRITWQINMGLVSPGLNREHSAIGLTFKTKNTPFIRKASGLLRSKARIIVCFLRSIKVCFEQKRPSLQKAYRPFPPAR